MTNAGTEDPLTYTVRHANWGADAAQAWDDDDYAIDEDVRLVM